jgi:hypothetical protein
MEECDRPIILNLLATSSSTLLNATQLSGLADAIAILSPPLFPYHEALGVGEVG